MTLLSRRLGPPSAKSPINPRTGRKFHGIPRSPRPPLSRAASPDGAAGGGRAACGHQPADGPQGFRRADGPDLSGPGSDNTALFLSRETAGAAQHPPQDVAAPVAPGTAHDGVRVRYVARRTRQAFEEPRAAWVRPGPISGAPPTLPLSRTACASRG
eukprot:2736414-Prymnesium_polylepis.1